MENRKKLSKFDIDIEIKDLLWEFARRWRVIFILMIVCGIALTGYQYRIDRNKTDVVTVKKSQEELEKSMGKQDLDEVTAAVALKRQMDEKSLYMEESVLMRLNPYEENAVVLQYYVQADNQEHAKEVASAYRAYVNDNALVQDIIVQGNDHIKPMYLSELISICNEESNLYIQGENAEESMNLNVTTHAEDAFFSIKICGATKNEAEELAISVKAVLQQHSASVALIGTHQLILVGENSSVIVDQRLAELQNQNATTIKTIGNNLDKMKNEMTGDQISLYVYRTTVLKEENTNNSNTTVTTPKVTKISIKHLIIGIVLGIVLACAYIFVSYLFAPALRNEEEVKTLYGIEVLGMVDTRKLQKKKVFAVVDEFVLKLQHRRKKMLNTEQGIQVVSAKVLFACKKRGAAKVVLTSSISEGIPEDVLVAIKKQCEDQNLHVVIANDICYDVQALEQVSEIGTVVLVEKKRASLYDEMYSEIALCKAHDIHVIGMIVL